MTKVRTAARALGLAGLLAVAVVGALRCNHATKETDSGLTSSDGTMNYSINGVEVHDAPAPGFRLGKVAVIRWHAVNNSAKDLRVIPHLKVYQNKLVLHPDTPVERTLLPEPLELAPGGEFSGSSTYRIFDMSPITVKITDPRGESNELNEIFNLK